jgi:DNA-binding PadR family transcriptional regulator
MDVPRLSNKEHSILHMLITRDGEMYGLEMVKVSMGAVKRGTIYVTLGRMADKGYVDSRQEKQGCELRGSRRLFRATKHGTKIFAAAELARASVSYPRMTAAAGWSRSEEEADKEATRPNDPSNRSFGQQNSESGSFGSR